MCVCAVIDTDRGGMWWFGGQGKLPGLLSPHHRALGEPKQELSYIESEAINYLAATCDFHHGEARSGTTWIMYHSNTNQSIRKKQEIF